ncbi:MAG: hypothetical protein ACOZNI_06095 [Myxococcota bacterium]
MSAVSWAAIAALWLVAGAGVGAALARRGQPAVTAASALGLWPLLAPLLVAGPGEGGRVREAFARLEHALRQAGEPVPADLAALRDSLLASERRIADVDRLLAEEAGSPELEPLRAAREQAAAEVDAVVAEVARVRVLLGIAALAGDAEAVRDRLAGLLARARALEEVRGLEVARA